MIEISCNIIKVLNNPQHLRKHHGPNHHFCGHVMPLALMLASTLSKEPLYYLHQDNQNKEHYNIFGHVTLLPLLLTSHDTTGVGVICCHWHQCQGNMMLTAS